VSAAHVERGDGWELHLGDCLNGLSLLNDRSVTVTITDPPYEAEAHTEGRRQLGKDRAGTHKGSGGRYRKVLETPLAFAPIANVDRVAVAAQIARVTQHRALAFFQAEAVADWRDAFNAGGIPYRRAMPWVKPDAMPSLHGRWPGQSYESIVLAMHPSAPPCPVGGRLATLRVHARRGALPPARREEDRRGRAAPDDEAARPDATAGPGLHRAR